MNLCRKREECVAWEKTCRSWKMMQAFGPYLGRFGTRGNDGTTAPVKMNDNLRYFIKGSQSERAIYGGTGGEDRGNGVKRKEPKGRHNWEILGERRNENLMHGEKRSRGTKETFVQIT